MKLISEFVDYAVEPVIVEQNEKGKKNTSSKDLSCNLKLKTEMVEYIQKK